MDGVEKTYTGEYTSDVLADLTIDAMRRFGSSPFALSLHFWAPHANQALPDGFSLPYQDRTWLPLKDEDLAPWRDMNLSIPNPEFPNLDVPRIERMMREYYASVHSVDRNVGRILAFLDESGLANNTVVIFTSDQGYNMAHNGLWHKGNGWWITTDRKDPAGIYDGNTRDNLFDNSTRVPGIVRWPGRIAPGTRISDLVSFVDWFPTLLDMAGVALSGGTTLRGRSVLPLLRRQRAERCEGVFGQHRRLRAYRDREWKLVRDFSAAGLDELYHVREDPFEKRNLIHDTHPRIQRVKARLQGRIERIMQEIDDPLFVTPV